jgi:nuclear pore complex protein Nup54
MSLFGGNKPTTGLFGTTQPSQPSLFGNTSNMNANMNASTSTNANPIAPATGFGSLLSQQQQPGSFNVGQSSTNTSGGPGLFSSTAQTQNPLGSSSSIPPLSQPVPTGSLFGSKPPLPSMSSFLPAGQAQQSSDNGAQAQSVALQQRIEAVVAGWNPQSPQCRFQVCDIVFFLKVYLSYVIFFVVPALFLQPC